MLTILPGAFLGEYALMVLLIALVTMAGVTLLAPIIKYSFCGSAVQSLDHGSSQGATWLCTNVGLKASEIKGDYVLHALTSDA
jgi:Flp pilus assembly pilin Flp